MSISSIVKYWPIVATVLLAACAQVVAPSGGPKDVDAPKVIGLEPENFTTEFTTRSIRIDFDEYIKLSEPATKILISPPLPKAPEYTLKRKSLYIKLSDSLIANTTYSINFGEAIKDNNEGNVLEGMTYVFSTGTFIDSMQVRGSVSYALDGKPSEGAFVMLYDLDIDSLPYDTTPYYFTKTDASGSFLLANLRDTKYRIFALEDANANFKYDQQEEKIAFIDSMISPDLPPIPADTSAQVVDSLAVDSVPVSKTEFGDGKQAFSTYKMSMFQEQDTIQFLKRTISNRYGKVQFVYNLPVGKFRVLPLDTVLNTGWRIKDYSAVRDTVTLWLKNLEADSLKLMVQADKGRIDTVEVALKEREETFTISTGRGKKKTVRFQLGGGFVNGRNRSPKPEDSLLVKLSHPISSIEIDSISLIKDSVEVPFSMAVRDTAFREFAIIHPWESEAKYELLMLPRSFTDIYGLTSDTLESSFTAMKLEDLGKVMVQVTPPANKSVVLELTTSDGKVLETAVISSKRTVTYSNLTPSNYGLRATIDANNNGAWDTGKYLKHIQPEQIIIYEGKVEVRANWDLELEWDLAN